MGARDYKGLPRSLGVGPIRKDPIYRSFHGSIGPGLRLPEPAYGGGSLRGVCNSWTSMVYKAMSRL